MQARNIMLQNAYTPGSRRIRENPLFINIDDRWIPWSERTPETANLLNPAFCAAILYAEVAEYQKKATSGMAFPLLYLILPILLHQDTRSRVDSRTNMLVWLQRHPDVLVGFPEIAGFIVRLGISV